MLRLCGVALLSAGVALLLGEMGFRGKRIFVAFTALMLISAVGDGLFSVIGVLGSFSESAGIAATAAIALKIVFLGYLFGVCADVCQELGEGTLATALTLVGRVEMFVLVLPKFKEILNLGIELIG